MSGRATRGEGRILGKPGVYHYPVAHGFAPSTQYGYGTVVESLCGRTSGIAYNDDTLHNLFPEDRLCKWCERGDARGKSMSTWEVVNRSTSNTLGSYASEAEAINAVRGWYRIGCDDELVVVAFDAEGHAAAEPVDSAFTEGGSPTPKCTCDGLGIGVCSCGCPTPDSGVSGSSSTEEER